MHCPSGHKFIRHCCKVLLTAEPKAAGFRFQSTAPRKSDRETVPGVVVVAPGIQARAHTLECKQVKHQNW